MMMLLASVSDVEFCLDPILLLVLVVIDLVVVILPGRQRPPLLLVVVCEDAHKRADTPDHKDHQGYAGDGDGG